MLGIRPVQGGALTDTLTPFAVWQVEDSPALSGGRHGGEDPERARGYWLFEEPAVFARAA